MKAIMVNIEKGLEPPTKNGFAITVFSKTPVQGSPVFVIDTGMSLFLPDDVELKIEPASDSFILAHSLHNGRLILFATGSWETEGNNEILSAKCKCPENGAKIATGWLVCRELAKVRFLEFGENGSRIIRGDGVKVEHRDKNTDTNS